MITITVPEERVLTKKTTANGRLSGLPKNMSVVIVLADNKKKGKRK